jgi:hypothetical protein
MDRRKFLIGAGALASGSAAAMGTGALASVRAERNLNIQTTGDAGAYLSLNVENSEYASQTGETLEVQVNELNANADTAVYNVLSIENTSSNDLQIGINPGGAGLNSELPNGPLGVFYSESELDGPSVGGLTAFPSSPAPDYISGYDDDPNSTQIVIESGTKLFVHFIVYLNSATQELGSGASTSQSDIPNQLGIYVDATPESDFE